MEKHNASACAPADEDRGQKCRQFKGIRMRKWGKWVSEIRMPMSQERIWLGSYNTAEQAARAYDAAVYCLRGPAGKLNFPDSVPNIPSASSLSRQQIQRAATKYALGEISSTSFPLHNNSDNSEAREKRASPSGSSWISETDFSGNGQQISKELVDWDLWESLFDGRNDSLNLEKLPSNGESSASEFVPTGQQK